MPRSGPSRFAALQRKEFVWSVMFVTLFALAGSVTILLLGRQPRFFAGQQMTEPVVARVPFVHTDEERTILLRQQAIDRQPPVFRANEELYEKLRESFRGLPSLADAERLDQVPPDLRDSLKLTANGLRSLRERFAPVETPEARQEQYDHWERLTQGFLRDLFNIAVLLPEQYANRGDATAPIEVAMPDQPAGAQRPVIYASLFYSLDDTKRIGEWIRDRAGNHFGSDLAPTVAALVMKDLAPTYFFDDGLTRDAKRLAGDRVRPIEKPFNPGDVLVKAGDRTERPTLELLEREWYAYEASLPLQYRALRWSSVIGLVALIGIGLWAYIWTYNFKVVRNPMRGFALVTLLLLMQLLAVSMTSGYPKILYATALVPTLLATVILAIVYDQRFALAVGAFHTALIMLSLSLPISFAIVLLTGIGVSISMLGEIRTRSKVVVVGAWSGLAMAAATVLSAVATRDLLIDGELRRIVTQDALFALLSGLLVGMFVQAMLPAVERLFRVTTSMTLRELNDANHPLLKRLAQEAPGTYQHSLRIADMAEAAAESVCGNGLLSRVGAMYHDIGKVNKPMYFIENQGGGPNRHAKLSPAMSLLIIVGHVKDGVEMAREAGLPPCVRHFIESHHGTTLVEYFYHAARKQKEAEQEDAPSEFEFRYPGPKPQTKEAAIILLCDSIEAAARSLPDPTPIRIEQLVHNMAMKRLMDGQFDECNLTLSDLHKIENAITKTLNAIYHARIKYPGDKPLASPPQLRREDEGEPPPQAATA